MDRSLIGRTWAEWEESVSSGVGDDQAEEEYAAYRRTVAKETPLLMLEPDVKSEVGSIEKDPLRTLLTLYSAAEATRPNLSNAKNATSPSKFAILGHTCFNDTQKLKSTLGENLSRA